MQINPEDLASRLQAGEQFFFIDVRQPEEHAYCAFPQSELMPLGELPSTIQELSIPKEQPIIVYCHHGIRSLSGAALLEQAGFSHVFSLRGGIDAWSVLVDPSIPRY